MRYIIDLNKTQTNEINSLIEKGRYQSFAQFISTAVENQIYIEKTELEEQSFDVGRKEVSQKEESRQKKDYPVGELPLSLSAPTTLPPTVPSPSFSELACSLYEVDEEQCWLWGQTNKIFPVKLGLRALLTFIDSEEWMELESFRNKAAEVASTFGRKILSYEEKKNKKRDERISAGLPIGFEEYKSKMRYKGHFLAFMRKDGKLDGALAFLRFVNLTKNKNGNVLIGLTNSGIQFASLDNLVIDHNDFDKSLSEKEISFYLSHISKNVRGEFSAIKWILVKLSNGIRHIDEINNELKKEFGDLWEASDAVINTQRAGLMARMIELGLIDRVRKGIRVYYYMSERGKTFLKKAGNHH